MQGSDRMRSLSNRRVALDKNLPSLRSSALASKAIIALSKVDIDSRSINRNRPIRSSALNEKQQPRSHSGLNLRRQKDQPNDSKILTRMQFEGLASGQFKLALRDIKEEDAPSVPQVMIDKAKVSSKGYGIVRAYSANSHPGPLLSFNQDRICIVTNLTKTNVRQKQVSFFGVYDGTAGVARADYMRDNFHLTLTDDPAFPQDMDAAMRHALRKIGNTFADEPRFSGDESSVGFVIIVTFNDEVHYLQSGTCKAVLSGNKGAELFFPARNETALLTKEPAKKSKSVGELVRKGKGGRDGADVEYRKFGSADCLDFVALGSEGVFENLKIRELGRKIWLNLLRNKEESIHFAVGETNNALLSEVFAAQGTKNSSLIIVAFEPVQECLQGADQREELRLPYVAHGKE